MSSRPFASIVVRTQGHRPRCLADALACLGTQSLLDFEVLLMVHTAEVEHVNAVHAIVDRTDHVLRERVRVFHVEGGGRARPLNRGLDAARGEYLAFLDDDDLVTPDWVEAFRAGAHAAPEAIVRGRTAVRVIEGPPRGGAGTAAEALLQATTPYASIFDFVQHLHDNQTPICSFAVPIDRARVAGLRFDDELLVNEDWDFLLQAALSMPVHDTLRITSVYQQWSDDVHSSRREAPGVWVTARRHIISKLDRQLVPLPPGSVSQIVSALSAEAQLEGLRAAQAAYVERVAHLESIRAHYAAITESWSWRALKPLHRLMALARGEARSRG